MSAPVSGTSSPLVRFAGDGPVVRRLFCFPFAGGSAATFRAWPQTLPGTEVLVMRYPGREPGSTGAPLTSIEAMRDFSLNAIGTAADLPYALFGHSMGAAVAYEVVAELEGRGDHSPEHIFVSGRRAPDAIEPESTIHQLPDDEFIIAMDKRFGGIPDVIRNEPDLLAMFLPILRADVTAYETYVRMSDRQIACPASVFGGIDDTRPSPADLESWASVLAAPRPVRTFPGGHFYINDQGPAVTAQIACDWNPSPVGS